MRWNRLPKKLHICSRTVKVVVQKDLAATTGNMGEATYQPPKIAIDANIPESMLSEVLLHEIIHHINEVQGNQFDLDENKTKALAIALALVFEQLFRV